MYLNRSEFKSYVRSFCGETGIEMPGYEVRNKLFTEFNNVTYSDKVDMECLLWEFLEDNLFKKKNMNPMTVSFGCIAATTSYPVPKACKPCNQKEEGTTPMNYNETEASRKYLNGRLSDAVYAKRDELVKTFNINNSEYPSNYKVLIDAITNGKYTLDPKRTAVIDAGNDSYNYSPFDGIKFKLDNSPDLDGYCVAEKAMEKQRTATKDIINTGAAAAGLKALQDFEAWTPTPSTPVGNG